MLTTLARRLPASFFLVSMLACTGCGDGAPEGSSGPGAGGASASSASGSGPRLRFITNGTSDWWNAVEKGMHDGAAEFKSGAALSKPAGDRSG